MKRLALLTALLLLLAGCDTAAPEEEGPGLGTLTARIDGERFTSVFAVAQPCVLCPTVYQKEGIKIGGFDSEGRSIGLALVGVSGEGTYPFGENGSGGTVMISDGSFATDWEGGSGSVEVTRSTGETIEGTFSFTALIGPGGVSVRVTEGRFNVPFQEIP